MADPTIPIPTPGSGPPSSLPPLPAPAGPIGPPPTLAPPTRPTGEPNILSQEKPKSDERQIVPASTTGETPTEEADSLPPLPPE